MTETLASTLFKTNVWYYGKQVMGDGGSGGHKLHRLGVFFLEAHSSTIYWAGAIARFYV